MRLPGPHFPILSRRLGTTHLSPDPFSKKNGPGAEACQDKWDFPSSWPWPHLPVSCSDSNRKDLLPRKFWKKRAPAPQLVSTCSSVLAQGKDLTFPCWVPTSGERFCLHTHLWKNDRRFRGPVNHVLICYWCRWRHTFPVWWKPHVENCRNLGNRAPLTSNIS